MHTQQECSELSKPGPISVKEEGWVNLNKAADLKAAIAQQPTVVQVDSSQDVFKYHNSGIISNATACGAETDEPLLAIGYGKDNATNLEYYLVRNNWGADWGEEGYARIAINGDGAGVCGIQTNPYFAVSQEH